MKERGVKHRPAAGTVGEEHQNRYIWKITPNLNETMETLQKFFA
jgi:hypothetical protein